MFSMSELIEKVSEMQREICELEVELASETEKRRQYEDWWLKTDKENVELRKELALRGSMQ